jgi:putative hydrolase of the HAD superfamily
MPYQHLFFDLDHTLWDFHANQITTLQNLFKTYNLQRYFKDFDDFFEQYMPINIDLWHKYQQHLINKTEVKTGRFYKTFQNAGLDNMATSEAFANDFVNLNSQQTKVIPYTFELLDYLKHTKYHLHIITNGFKEAQNIKMNKSGLTPYFEKVFISEDIGVSKPHRRFFEHALKSVNARKRESLVIGDSLENDIKGAGEFGIDSVYYNPAKQPHTYSVFKEITSLKELIGWL